MRDSHGRDIDYLRVSVTDRCNLRCRYCMPEEGVTPLAHTDVLSYEEIVRAVEGFAALGVRKVKVTGGEPLVRRGVLELLRSLKALPGLDRVTVTTNGVLLEEAAEALVAMGIDGVNVSLDTLDRERFAKLTGRDRLDRVLAGLRRLLDAGCPNVKLNCVPLRGINEDDLVPLAGMARGTPLHVRFIEMMPVGLGRFFEGIPSDEVLGRLRAAFGPEEEVREALGHGPARYVSFGGFRGKVGFIGAMSHKFCEVCNRVRLTASGTVRLCLHQEEGFDIRSLLAPDVAPGVLAAALRAILVGKPREHRFGELGVTDKNMHQIGG